MFTMDKQWSPIQVIPPLGILHDWNWIAKSKNAPLGASDLAKIWRCKQSGDIHKPKQIENGICKQLVRLWGKHHITQKENMMKHRF